MKRNKFILPVFIGTVVYSILSFCVGPRGVWPMGQLLKQKNGFSNNLEVLYTINEEMDARLKNLSADPDTIAIYAHELGYISEGEQLIKLAGFSGGIDRNLFAGNAIIEPKPVFLPEWVCKSAGIVSGLVMFFLFSFSYISEKSGRRKKLNRF